ncbi:MAG: hypothetical protein LC125_09575 [Burkholderiales bacterium]|nr:hypothetical protein [Burkholderiales bacterium]
MAIAKLSIDLEARLASLQAGLDKAGLLAERTSRQISGAFAGIKSVAATVGPALAASLSVAGIAAFVKETAAGIDALNDLSDATGASVENLSALEDAAARTGTQMDTVGAALIKLNQQLANTDPKSGASQALTAIGLSAEELRRLDPAEALLQVAQALQGYADDGNKARLVQELFGKSVKEVAPLLKDLAESGKLNATVTKEQAEEVDRFNKNLAQLGKTATDVARDISGPLITAINNLLERTRKEGFLTALFTPTETGRAIQQAEDLSRAITVVTDRLLRADALSKNLDLPGTVRNKWAADAANLRAQLEDLQRRALNVTQGLKGAPPDEYGNEGRREVFRPSVPTRPTSTTAPKPAAPVARPETYDDAVTRSLTSLIAQTDTVKLAELNAQLAKLDELAAAGLDQKIVDDLRSILTPIDRGDVGPPISAELEKINALLAQTDSAQLAEAQRTLMLLNDELSKVDAGSARFVQLQEAILAAQDRLTELAGTFPELKKQTDDIGKDIGLTFSSAFEDAVVSGKKFSDILKGIGDDLLRLLVRRNITEPIVGAIGGVNWGSLLAGFLGSAKGNAFGPGGVIPFAAGGIVNSPTLFGFAGGKTGVMGEAGPEAILPLKRGRDGKLGVQSAGMGGVVINQTINVAAGASRNEVLQAAATAKAAAVAEIQDLMRRGKMSLRGA